MKKHMIFWLGLAVVFCFVGVGNATVLDFEDIEGMDWDTIQDGSRPINTTYGDFSWANVAVIDSSYNKNGRDNTDYAIPNLTDAGPIVAFNRFEGLSIISRDGFTFDFIGAYFSAAFAETISITIKGYKDGYVNEDDWAFSQGFFVESESSYEFIAADYSEDEFRNIVALQISSGRFFAMDNFEYSVVPEPATLLLLGVGIVALAGINRKRLRQRA